ncbi:hypothetical protein SEVIR_2G173600v4 [Setaria viridis]|uniref:Uncharacterized protein n=1 Tax=Setaria viridis TaxID=4556 RepID=A0A4U6VU64_SETVI|nr:hypothetical protein SEVIR_2G173600v2 [Setaria viridis]
MLVLFISTLSLLHTIHLFLLSITLQVCVSNVHSSNSYDLLSIGYSVHSYELLGMNILSACAFHTVNKLVSWGRSVHSSSLVGFALYRFIVLSSQVYMNIFSASDFHAVQKLSSYWNCTFL